MMRPRRLAMLLCLAALALLTVFFAVARKPVQAQDPGAVPGQDVIAAASPPAKLTIYGKGAVTGTTVYTGQYTTLYVGFNGVGDWPHCSGSIDSVVVAPLSGNPIVEEFDSSIGFSTLGNTVSITQGKAVWDHVYMSGGNQFVYRSIPTLSGNVRVIVRGQVDWWQNNCQVHAGIADSPRNDGIGVQFGFTGGGCSHSGPYITTAWGVIPNSPSDGCTTVSSFPGWVSAGVPYTTELVIGDAQAPYLVTGRVTDGSGNPIGGVNVSAGGGINAITDNSGRYIVTGLISGTIYSLTPSKSGYTFSPPTRANVSVPPDRTGQNFVGTPPSTPWTVMEYLDGDNNLDLDYAAIFNQIEAVADNPNVKVLALWDRIGDGGSAYYDVQFDTVLTRPAAYTASVNYWPQGELDMGDPQTLVDFVDWARSKYPAQHYALVLKNHGTGLGGAMLDETSNDILHVPEISSALAAVTLSGTQKIDVLYIDACLMAMIEDAYQVRDYVDSYVASENLHYSWSRPYRDYISDITAATTPEQLAALFTNAYADYGDSVSAGYTQSAADISRLGTLVASTNSLAWILNSQMITAATQVTAILTDVQRFDSDEPFGVIDLRDRYIDLHDFARLVHENFAGADLKTAAQGVMDAVASYVRVERHRGSTLVGSHGVSIFYPTTASSFYNADEYDFATGATWHGSSGVSSIVSDATVEWGPMLVKYFQVTQPGGPDNPTPPLPKAEIPERQPTYLPVITR